MSYKQTHPHSADALSGQETSFILPPLHLLPPIFQGFFQFSFTLLEASYSSFGALVDSE